MGQKPVLGKGLASLLPTAGGNLPPPIDTTAVAGTAPSDTPNRDRHPGISLASVEDIQANEFQPRRDFEEGTLQELAESIKANGIIQPLVVRKTENGYRLIAGERRLRAAKLAGLKQVPIVIRKSTDLESLELALIENVQREDLNCIDTALAYFQLSEEFTLTQEEIARRVGKDRASISNHLRLLRLPEEIIDDLRRGTLTFGHGKALLSLEGGEARLTVRKEILEKKLSVRETEALVEKLKANQMGTGAEVARSDDGRPQVANDVKSRLFHLSQDLTRQFSAKVEVRGSEKKGKIVIHYSNRDELERLLTAMQNSRQTQGVRVD
jgi:ParB family chromosome partitioning protein